MLIKRKIESFQIFGKKQWLEITQEVTLEVKSSVIIQITPKIQINRQGQSSGNIYNQSNQHSFRSSGGSCSYKMPKIKVSSNEEVFQNLKKILVDLKGNSSLLFSKRKGNYENSQADMSFYQSQLPDIIIVDEKKKKLKEQEQKQIEKSINQFKTLKDLNESLLKLPKHHSHTTNNSPTRQFSKKTIFQSIRESKANLLQRNESIEILNPLLDRKPSQEPTVFHTNNLFQLNYDKSCLEKFYKYKSEMKDKDGFRVSIKSCYDEKLIIFLGEAASFVKIDEITAQYIGGLSVHANNDILEFENLNYQVSWKSLQQPYFKQNSAQDMSYLLRRNGHTSLYYKEKIVIFGGEKGKTIGPSLRDLTNDLLILDPSTNDIFRQTYDRALLYNRMYHQAFIIDDSLFIFGGQTNGSKPLDELIEIDLNTYIYSKQEIENIQLVGAITNHKCCPVFYPSRHHKDSRISMKKLAQEVNWSESEHFIQQEGIYLFGGRNINNETQGKLFVMTITFNNQNKPIKRFIEPLTQGQTPPARYMHSMDYYKQGNLLVIVGGRNDQLHDYQITSLQQSYSQYILDDIWILKLSNLEWQRISPSNQYTELVKPRFNFCSVILGSTLIIAGGIGKDFKLLKDYQEIELDQSKIKKRSQNYVQINKNNNSRLIGGLRNNKEGSESNLSKSKMQKYEDLLKSKK
eukprot:403364919